MSQNSFVDDRARQATLIKQPKRPEKESEIDRGSSDEFADDRQELENSENSGEQSNLTAETVDDGNQKDLTGEIAGESPEWEVSQ